MAEASDEKQCTEPGKRWWQAHEALQHGHNELVKRVDIHQESIKQLVDQQRDNHVQVMAGLTRVEQYIVAKEGLKPGQALTLFAVFMLLLVIAVGVYR